MYDKFLNETLVDAIDEIRESPNDYMTLRLRKNAQTGEAFMLELASYDEDKEEEEGEQQETEGIEKNEKGEEIVISIRLESYANPESRDVRIMLGATRIYYQVNESNEEIYRSTLKIDGKTYFTMNVSRIHSTYNMAIYDGREGKIFQLSGKWNFTEEEQTVSIDTLHHNGVELLFSASVTLKKAEMPQKSEYRNSIFDMKYDYLDEYLFNYLEAKKKENENPIRDWYDRINGKI